MPSHMICVSGSKRVNVNLDVWSIDTHDIYPVYIYIYIVLIYIYIRIGRGVGGYISLLRQVSLLQHFQYLLELTV